jgi:hypothetical protein
MSQQSFSIAVYGPRSALELRRENVRDGAIHITYGKTRAARQRIPMTSRVEAIIENRIASEQDKIDRSLQSVEFDGKRSLSAAAGFSQRRHGADIWKAPA